MHLGKQKKIRCKVLSFPGMRFDVDQPRDLCQLMRYRIQNETIRVLSTLRTAGTCS
jgi:2-phospho-L-lactate guanylyltransferase (CobY/MobA/RfbA family)